MFFFKKINLRIVFILFCIPIIGFSQKKKIEHIHSDLIESKELVYQGNPVFTGNVKFKHEGSILTADTVIYFLKENSVIARSNVYMNVGDTVSLTAKILEYNGNTKQAIAKKNVRLQDKSQTLETEELVYDRNTNKAFYNSRSKIIQQDNIMYSSYGVYNLNTQSTFFDKNVDISTKEQNINSTNLTFYNNQNKAVFKGPTTIESKKNPQNYIYTEDGTFFTKSGEAFLKKNSKIYYNQKILSGDEMYFNEKTGFGKGTGNVTLNDPKERRFIKGGYGEVYQKQDSAIITQKPYVVKAFKKDSLYLAAQTIIAKRDINKKSIIQAYKQVRVYKSDIQAKSDSLVFKETIGQMHFYKDPVFWSGPRQLTGDTLVAFININTEKLDSIYVNNNAFAISKTDSLTQTDFNQVKGRNMIAKVDEDELSYVNVKGNSEALVFVDEEDKENNTVNRIGINKSVCGIIEADFIDRLVHIISCEINAEGKLYPVSKIPIQTRYLKDFRWRENERLIQWQDIFLDIPENGLQNFSPTTFDFNTITDTTRDNGVKIPETQKPNKEATRQLNDQGGKR